MGGRACLDQAEALEARMAVAANDEMVVDENAERLANDNPGLIITAPFVDMNKSQIVKLGAELGVPYKETWSCYKGGEIHCGVCSSCRERKRAFQEVGVMDPTKYEK